VDPGRRLAGRDGQNASMPAAGLLLTGGSSRRMGSDKATLAVGPEPAETLAVRTGRLLASVTDPTLEVGPGRSRLVAVPDRHPGAGPLAAIATGVAALAAKGWNGPAVVVATDLPRVTVGLLAWLADHPGPRSVIPSSAGRLQPLCARWSPDDLQRVEPLVAAGHRAIRDLLAGAALEVVGPEIWALAAGSEDALVDVDTPDDWQRVVAERPGGRLR
jgi:molybdopterin-guanine dinucleotide biosynthesis protein A